MKIGAILPHLQKFGGVRRFLELGNKFVEKKIDYIIFSKEDQKCDWFEFKGRIKDWSKIRADYILIADPPSFKVLPKIKGKIFIYVIAGGKYIPMYSQVYKKYPFILNNRIFKKYFPDSYIVEGGVNTKYFSPKKRKVLYYNRGGKGASYIVKQLKDLENIELVGLENLNNEQMRDAYQNADYFAAWEKREGWCNTAAEALASGLTVVTNGVNCEPFKDRVIIVKNLRDFFANPMKEFSWEIIADKLLKIFKNTKYKSSYR